MSQEKTLPAMLGRYHENLLKIPAHLQPLQRSPEHHPSSCTTLAELKREEAQEQREIMFVQTARPLISVSLIHLALGHLSDRALHH